MTGWNSYWTREEASSVWREADPQIAALAKEFWEQGIRRVLDYGCGAGRHTVFLAQQGFQVYGCDPSPMAVSSCRRWLQESKLRAKLKLVGTNQVPYPNGFFPWVIAFNVVYHNTLKDMKGLIAQLLRVTHRGGYLFLTLQSTRNSKYGLGREIEPGTFLNPQDPLEYERELPHHFSDEAEVYRLFQGLRVLEAQERADNYTRPGKGGSYHWYVLLQKPLS